MRGPSSPDYVGILGMTVAVIPNAVRDLSLMRGPSSPMTVAAYLTSS